MTFLDVSKIINPTNRGSQQSRTTHPHLLRHGDSDAVISDKQVQHSSMLENDGGVPYASGKFTCYSSEATEINERLLDL